MLASKLLVALFALPLAALAQESAASTDAAAATDAATTDATASADGSASDTAAAAASTSKSSEVGADINNTGNGQSSGSTGNWTIVQFTAPSQDYYWVLNVENTAVWTPYTEPVNLVLFNSNSTIFSGNKTIAENIPAGTGTWSGEITGYNPGNNYIIAVAPVSNPTRKVGQTRGFWIKRAGTVTISVPSSAANSSDASATATGSAASNASGASSTSAGASSTASNPAAVSPTSGADALAISAAAVFGALALALSL